MTAVRFLDILASFIARALSEFGSGRAPRVEKPSFFALLAPDPIETPRGLRREAEPWPGKRRSLPELLAMRGGELFQLDRVQAKFPNRFKHARGGR
jgi:hypothetical protein